MIYDTNITGIDTSLDSATLDTDAYKRLLHMADKYSIKRARDDALAFLSIDNRDRDTGCISAAEKINLARIYAVEDWVEPNLRFLVSTDLDLLPLSDYVYLRPDLTRRLVRSQFKILRQRHYLATHMERAVHLAGCRKDSACQLMWETVWWSTGRSLLKKSFGQWPAGADVLNRLETAAVRITDMEEECRTATLKSLRDRGVLTEDAGMAEEEIERITAYLKVKDTDQDGKKKPADLEDELFDAEKAGVYSMDLDQQ